MKTKISILIALFLMSVGVNAQIDRSKQPKPGPSPKISLKAPKEFKLKNGLTVLVVENHKLPRVSFSLRIDNPPMIEGDKAGVSNLLGSMLGNGTMNISKDEFNEEIDFLGARLNFGFGNASASSLSKYSDRILELMADAAMHPLLTEEEFQKEKEKLIEGLKTQDKDVSAIADRLGSALSYGTDHAYGEFVTGETVSNVTLADVNAFYKKYFNPNNAYLVIVGDVNYRKIKKQVKKRFKKWEKSDGIFDAVPEAKMNAQTTEIDFIDMPNAVQSNISLTSNVDLKMSDTDYHAVLIANKILGGGFNSYLNMNLREEHGYTYGARSNVGSDKYVARFTAGASVRNAVTDSAVVQTLKEIVRIKNEDVADDALANAKAKYVGDFVLALERPQTIARYALNIKLNDLPANFYTTYLEKINNVSTADVKRVANKYFKTENARIVVVGKGSEVIENLEKTGIPIKYFDKNANSIEKPIYEIPIPNDVDVNVVLNSYINAIGGKENAKAINSITVSADVTITGVPVPLTAEMKAMNPYKESMEMTAAGMGVLMKQKFDGKSGYTEQQGSKKDLTPKEITEKKSEYTIFPELHYDLSTLSIEGIEKVNGENAYKIKVNGAKTSYRFYDVKTGFLIRVKSSAEMQGQTISTTVDFSDYAKVGDIQVPFTQSVQAGPQNIVMKATDIKINESFTDADFE